MRLLSWNPWSCNFCESELLKIWLKLSPKLCSQWLIAVRGPVPAKLPRLPATFLMVPLFQGLGKDMCPFLRPCSHLEGRL